jgi:hypothetical protein
MLIRIREHEEEHASSIAYFNARYADALYLISNLHVINGGNETPTYDAIVGLKLSTGMLSISMLRVSLLVLQIYLT